jgi:hypothetical protein
MIAAMIPIAAYCPVMASAIAGPMTRGLVGGVTSRRKPLAAYATVS